jgi:hypothetical protein
LGGVLRLLGRITSIRRDKAQLGPTHRCDAAAIVNVIDRHLGALQHQVTLACPGSRQRRDQPDLYFLRLGQNGWRGNRQSKRSQCGRDDTHYCTLPDMSHHQSSMP